MHIRPLRPVREQASVRLLTSIALVLLSTAVAGVWLYLLPAANNRRTSVPALPLVRAIQLLDANAVETNQIEITQAVQSNAVFARIPKAWIKPLKDTCFFYVWDEREWIVRLMLSFDNSSEDISRFRSSIGGLRG